MYTETDPQKKETHKKDLGDIEAEIGVKYLQSKELRGLLRITRI